MVVQTIHRRPEISCTDDDLPGMSRGLAETPGLIRFSQSPNVLHDFSTTAIAVIRLPHEILADSVEVTHCHHTSFEIFDSKKANKNLLGDICRRAGPDQPTEKTRHLGVVCLVQILHQLNSRWRWRFRRTDRLRRHGRIAVFKGERPDRSPGHHIRSFLQPDHCRRSCSPPPHGEGGQLMDATVRTEIEASRAPCGFSGGSTPR